MKNLYTAFKNGKLTPKQRMLLIVHNSVKKDKTGEGILTEAEKHAIGGGWIPANNKEVAEYNAYSQAWLTAGLAESQAQAYVMQLELTFHKTSLAYEAMLINTQEILFNEKIDEIAKGLPADKKKGLRDLKDYVAFGRTVISPTGQTITRLLPVGLEKGRVLDDLLTKNTDTMVNLYANLLAFKELFTRLSKVYQIDLTYRIDDWIKESRKLIELSNLQLSYPVYELDAQMKARGKKTELPNVNKYLINHMDIQPNLQAIKSYETRIKGELKDAYPYEEQEA